MRVSFLPFESSTCWRRVVLLWYLVSVPLLMTKSWTYSNRPDPAQRLSRYVAVGGVCHDEAMTELAYMTRDDWAQHATAMVAQSAVIRDWLGEAPYLLAMTEMKKYGGDGSVDLEAARFIAPDNGTRIVFDISELGTLARQGKTVDHAVVVLHPRDERSLEAMRTAAETGAVSRLFVLISWPLDIVRSWLDGRGALNLHTGETTEAPDPLMVDACTMMISHQYNGLSSGRGKEAVVQLVRAFHAERYPYDVDAWLRAYFAAGGDFRHGESIKKLVTEMKAGVKHRVAARYRDNIFEIIRSGQLQQEQ